MPGEKHEEVRMNGRAQQFVTQWVAANVSANDYVPQSDNTEARALAARLLDDAEASGVPRREVEAYAGDVVSFLAEEIKRLAGKDR
jgi:hypothetical protein